VVALVLGCFCMCWLPYLIIVTILVHGVRSNVLDLAYKLAFSFAMANSCMNPVIYAWKNQDFKTAFQQLLACCQKNAPPTPGQLAAAASRRASALERHAASAVSIIELSTTTPNTP
jgi:7 transmembrane receptor (rhodopsin family)